MRATFRAENPLCAMCSERGVVEPGVEVDHITPHKGDLALFFDASNLQNLCRFHHRSVKARIERGKGGYGCDADGMPIDPEHHWNKDDHGKR